MLRVQESGVPAPVRRFIAGHIESVGQLEVLLLLRAAADKQWTADEVARAVVTQPASAAGWLEQLRADLDAKDFMSTGTLWTDWATARILQPYMRPMLGGDKVWDAPVKSITSPGATPRPGDHVLLFRGSLTCTFCLNALQPWRQAHPDGPPASWKPVFTSDTDNLVLYEVQG